jgi:hypothetical protein
MDLSRGLGDVYKRQLPTLPLFFGALTLDSPPEYPPLAEILESSVHRVRLAQIN